MPHEPPLPLGYETTMVIKYQNNLSIRMIANQFGVPAAFVRRLLVRNGLEIKPAGSFVRERTRVKLPDDKLLALRYDLLQGELHATVARNYNVSREWVRQLAKSWGFPTGRDVRANRRNARLQLVIGRQVHDLKTTTVADRYVIWRELWAKGYTAREMAVTLSLSPRALAVRICILRKQYPAWFPTRRAKPVAVEPEQRTIAPAMPE